MTHIKALRFQNFRSLHKLEIREIGTLAVFVGPNGGGKSTILDALGFVADYHNAGLLPAVANRGGLKELRTRGQEESVVFEAVCRVARGNATSRDCPVLTYHLEIGEGRGVPVVADEWVQRQRRHRGALRNNLKAGPLLGLFSGWRTGRAVLPEDALHSSILGVEGLGSGLHPVGVPRFVEECREAAKRVQVFATTYSNVLLDWLAPEEVFVVSRNEYGLSRVVCAAKIPGVQEFVREGARLGQLWVEGHLGEEWPVAPHQLAG